ncbi:DUF1819 family protein [Arthrobacter bambusae]|uniref:DUF1819 family protein n=1 Tax=Arthrobacter bambusae TaxID=1338426 RepID=UPI002783AFAA|nr:DUF1819 family protein [Arthrobacter bambusae]MDQ0030887.1 hypothetical protein [Arthrobacter bambusae]MDQ0099252.1 hypothetical protein [Arthrobacter bambusae]
MGATAARPYALSFTTGALLTREASRLAPLYLEQRNWEQTRDRAVEDNLLQARTYRTSVRLVRETIKRISAFSDAEIALLTEATASERGYLMWAAACRRYELIGEFAEEIVRERFLVMASTLDYTDFDSFFRTKAVWHGELTQVKDSTLQKLRSNLFRMLVEASLLTDDGHIVPAALSERVAELLAASTPSDIRFFPTGGDPR